MTRKKDRDNRNEALAMFMTALRIPPVRIRRAIHQVVCVPYDDMARVIGAQRSQVTNNISGDRSDNYIQEGVARIWKVPKEVLFPDER